MPKNILLSVAIALAVAGMTGGANADLVISKKKTVNVNCSAGVCNATAADAVLNVKDLTGMLATSDVHVFAEGAATDITVADAFGWASSHQLTLGAYGSLNVKAAMSIIGTSGLTIATNVAGGGGLFRLVGVGKISFWDTNSTLVINSTAYTLINNLPGLSAAIAANPSGTYAFANDYNAAQDGSYPLSPIPTVFNGIVEGLGNAISNLTIYNSSQVNDKVALFYELGTGAQLSDLNLINASIQVYSAYPATLVGTNNGTVSHASASGTILPLVGSNWSSAGLVNDNAGIISRSHAAVNMTRSGSGYAGYSAGGLVASNEGTISLSDASGAIDAYGAAGGLASVSSGTITDSYAQGPVTISYLNGGVAGGLVALASSGTVLRCFATGEIQAGGVAPEHKDRIYRHGRYRFPGNHLGGLVGESSASVSYSYAIGNVAEEQNSARVNLHRVSLGGLVGFSSGPIRQSYALGRLDIPGHKFLGGVIGLDNTASGNNDAAFWDLDTTGVENPDQGAGNVFDDKGLKGFTDEQFRKAALRNLDHAVWAEKASINNGYPYLIANPPPPQ